MSLKNKIITSTFLGVLAGTALAGSTTLNPSHFGGVYAGVGFGGTNMTADWNASDNLWGNLAAGNLGINSPVMKASIGYGKDFDKSYLGVETDYLYASKTQEVFVNTDQDEVDLQDVSFGHSWGIYLRTGYQFLDGMMGYALVGPTSTQFRYTPVDESGIPHKFSSWETGITAGLGVEYMLNKNLSLDTRYTYTDYQQVKKDFTGTDGDPDGIKISPVINTLTLGVAYHFA